MGRKLAPVGYPASLAPQTPAVRLQPRARAPGRQAPIRCGALAPAAFFNDQRASRVGDILTVQIDIDDSAKDHERHEQLAHLGYERWRFPRSSAWKTSLGQDPARRLRSGQPPSRPTRPRRNAGAGQVKPLGKDQPDHRRGSSPGSCPTANMMIQGTQGGPHQRRPAPADRRRPSFARKTFLPPTHHPSTPRSPKPASTTVAEATSPASRRRRPGQSLVETLSRPSRPDAPRDRHEPDRGPPCWAACATAPASGLRLEPPGTPDGHGRPGARRPGARALRPLVTLACRPNSGAVDLTPHRPFAATAR